MANIEIWAFTGLSDKTVGEWLLNLLRYMAIRQCQTAYSALILKKEVSHFLPF